MMFCVVSFGVFVRMDQPWKAQTSSDVVQFTARNLTRTCGAMMVNAIYGHICTQHDFFTLTSTLTFYRLISKAYRWF